MKIQSNPKKAAMGSPMPDMLQAMGSRSTPRQLRRRDPYNIGMSPMPVPTVIMKSPTQLVMEKTSAMMMKSAKTEMRR